MSLKHTNIEPLPDYNAPAYLPKPQGPVNVILDTDLGNDCDDALALGVLHALQSRNACRILAVTLTNPEKEARLLAAAINTYYGRPEIPIGVSPHSPFVRPSPFLPMMHQKLAGGADRFPADLSHNATEEDAVRLMRRTLSQAEDNSVVIAQIGFFTNCAALLNSPADDISPLSGRELIAQKVRFFSVMAGAFGPVQYNNYWLEFNVVYDIPSAQSLAENWPTPIAWSGAEVGEVVPFPAYSVDHDYGYDANHPLKEAYQLFRATPHERPTWDLTSVLYAVFPERDYFDLSIPGTVKILDDGYTRFMPSKGERDRYLILSAEQAGALRGLFSALCTEVPVSVAVLKDAGLLHSEAHR